jgi:RimJ/RimL family protein N-acetyltransferase
MAMPHDAARVVLRRFERAHLARVQPWFEDPEVRLRLGGPEWPARALELHSREAEGEEFRGRRVLRNHTWLAWDEDVPVGYLGGEVYDRWARYDGSDPERPRVSQAEPGPAMGSAYVVDPARWRRGYGAAMLRAWVAHPEVADVRLFALGIDADNDASRRCAEAAGFVPDSPLPDWEGTVHHLLRRW